MPKILISGAGIAGPALAYWLLENGHDVTIIERTPMLRPGGQAIDVRGAALRVLSMMGLAEEAHARRTDLRGMSVVDIDGNEIWRSEEETFSGGRFDSGDLEILRDDLTALLISRLGKKTRMLFGDSIIGIEEKSTRSLIKFERNDEEEFDIVVGADGFYSNVRRLTFDEDSCVHPLGVGLAVFTAPNILGLSRWQVAYREGQGGFLIYTARGDKELRVAVGFDLADGEDARISLAEQKNLVSRRCVHFRWEMPRLLESMQTAPDFYFGAVAQIKLESWSKGRVVLLGDAAYCPSPFSGQGTSLALVGAYILAAEIGRDATDPRRAFERYQEHMRPFVTLNQALAVNGGSIDKDEALAHAKEAISL